MKKLLPALLLAAVGCVQYDEILTLFPDGSGKLRLKLAVKKSLMHLQGDADLALGGEYQKLRQRKVTREDLRDPVKLLGPTAGFAAVKAGPTTEDGDWIRTSVTGYFKNLNEVRMALFEGPGARPRSPYGLWEKTDRGGTVTLGYHPGGLQRGMRSTQAELGETAEEVRENLEHIRPVLKDWHFRFEAILPGTARESSVPLTLDRRSAKSYVNFDKLVDLATAPDLLPLNTALAWSGEDVTPEELSGFRAELEAAKGVAAPAAAAAAKPASLGADADLFTDDEVDRLFIDAQLKVAREQIERGKKERARATLEGVLKDYPKAKAALEAQKLLDGLK